MYIFSSTKFGLGLGISAVLSIVNSIYLFLGYNLSKKESDICTANAECKVIRTEIFCLAFAELLTCMLSIIWFIKLLTKDYLSYFVRSFNDYVNYAFFYVLTRNIFFYIVHFCLIPLMYDYASTPKNPVNKIHNCSVIVTVFSIMQTVNPFFAIYHGFNKDNRNDFEEIPQDGSRSQYRIVNWLVDGCHTIGDLFSSWFSRNPQVPTAAPMQPPPNLPFSDPFVSPVPAPARTRIPHPPTTPYPGNTCQIGDSTNPKELDSVNIPIGPQDMSFDRIDGQVDLPSVTIHISREFSTPLSSPSTPEHPPSGSRTAQSTPPQETTALSFDSPSFPDSELPPTGSSTAV